MARGLCFKALFQMIHLATVPTSVVAQVSNNRKVMHGAKSVALWVVLGASIMQSSSEDS